MFSELARDFLNNTGRYRTIGGIISPVGDSYGEKVRNMTFYRLTLLMYTGWLLKNAQ